MSRLDESWSTLVATAVLGTERGSTNCKSPSASEAISRALSNAQTNEAESSLLSAAAILSTCIRAGQRGSVTISKSEPAAPPETLKACSRRFEVLLSRLLLGEHERVLPEAIQLLMHAHQGVPRHLLPQLLDLATEDFDLRDRVKSVAGERGMWLAERNPRWQWLRATSDQAEATWETGDYQNRVDSLQALRPVDPHKARGLVETTWLKESPEHRLGFISLFQINLSPEDEPFLEIALDDKRKEVRRLASDLLARLPGSKLGERMKLRITPLLGFHAPQKAKLVKLSMGKKGRLDVALSQECDKAMVRDGIESKPPHSQIGEKAWWLQQMIAATPPSAWTSDWNASPEDIITAAKDTEWVVPLLDGFAGAAARHKDKRWIVALIDNWLSELTFSESLGRVELINHMVHAIGPEEANPLLLRLLKNKDKPLHESAMLHLLRAARFNWSPELSSAVLKAMQRVFAKSSGGAEYSILSAAHECFCLTMSPTIVDDAEKGWPPIYARHINNFLKPLRFRSQLHKEINS